MGRTVIVAGIPGAGKTTVLAELGKLLTDRKEPVQIVNFGTIMKDIFEKKIGAIHRDDMRRQSMRLQQEVQGEACHLISKRSENSTVIVDTHMFVRTDEGYLPGTPSHMLSKLKPSLILLVEAPPEEIGRRRLSDKERVRDAPSPQDIEFELNWSRATAAACSVLTGAPVKVIMNEPGKQREAAENMLLAIKERQP